MRESFILQVPKRLILISDSKRIPSWYFFCVKYLVTWLPFMVPLTLNLSSTPRLPSQFSFSLQWSSAPLQLQVQAFREVQTTATLFTASIYCWLLYIYLALCLISRVVSEANILYQFESLYLRGFIQFSGRFTSRDEMREPVASEKGAVF